MSAAETFGRRNFREAHHRIVPGSFAVSSVLEYLEDAGEPNSDELILVDGWQIGRTYRCQDGLWASWGPAGLDRGHPDRRAAIDVQVREYALDPSGFDRLVADVVAEERAELERQEAARAAAAADRQEQRRRERLGDDEPGPTIWAAPAYHVMYADPEETTRVADWLDAQGITMVSALHEIRVEQRATRRAVVFERPLGPTATQTETHVVTLTTEPPAIATSPRPDLHGLLDEHHPAQFPLIDYGQELACAKCTPARNRASRTGMVVVPWPCEVLTAAIDRTPTTRPADYAQPALLPIGSTSSPDGGA